jgi:hypothetical protein
MNSAYPCSCCGEAGHSPSQCPVLRAPLKDGFWSGGNGGGGHSHDDDDEGAGAPSTSSKNLVHKSLRKALLGVPVPVPL